MEVGGSFIGKNFIIRKFKMIISKTIRRYGHVACMYTMRNAYKILFVKPERENTVCDG
jgi:hypothetical protein